MSCPFTLTLEQIVNRPDFVRKYPYYAGVLARMVPVVDPAVDVMGVSAHGGRLYLHVNVEFFARNGRHIDGVLQHEVHHVVLGHVTDERFEESHHPDLMQLAMEMSANEFIREPLPGQPIVWNDYREFGIDARQSTLHRYRLLVGARQAGCDVPHPEACDDHLPAGVGRGKASDRTESHARLPQLVADAIADGDEFSRIHGGSFAMLAGQTPGRMLEQLQEPERKTLPPDHWRTVLQLFAARLRAPVHNYSRPSRRVPQLVGVIPGRTYVGSRVDRPRILVALDTSASMTTVELREIAGQLQLLKGLIDITIVECDVVIQRTYPFAGRLEHVMGRGGTDLRPVFQPAFLKAHHPDGVIYFTDGIGPYPEEPPGVATLWVLTKPYAFGCSWGEQVVLRSGVVESVSAE